MDIKGVILKYKYWVAGGAVALIALYLLRGTGGSTGSTSGQAISTSYTTSDGQTANSYSDPTLMLAQLNAQTTLAGQQAQFSHDLGLAQMQKDISLATIDANKWMSNLDFNLQSTVAGINADAAKYTSNIQLQMQQDQSQVKMAEIGANSYIAQLTANSNNHIADVQASVINKQTSASKTNAWLGAIASLGSSAISAFGNSNSSTQTNTPKSYFV